MRNGGLTLFFLAFKVTQEMLNERHQTRIKRAKQMMKNKAQMRNGMDRERQKRWMRQRELREDRVLKNKRRKY